MPRSIALALLPVAAAGAGAARAQDREGLKSLVHPASLACIDAENRDDDDFVFAKESR